eukprot:1322094-Amorphochlora_amoeboformis.AAC.2
MAPKKGRGGTKSKRKRSNGNKGARGRSSKDKPVERPAIADKRFEHVHGKKEREREREKRDGKERGKRGRGAEKLRNGGGFEGETKEAPVLFFSIHSRAYGQRGGDGARGGMK